MLYIYNLTSICKKKKNCILEHFLVSLIDTLASWGFADQIEIASPRVS